VSDFPKNRFSKNIDPSLYVCKNIVGALSDIEYVLQYT